MRSLQLPLLLSLQLERALPMSCRFWESWHLVSARNAPQYSVGGLFPFTFFLGCIMPRRTCHDSCMYVRRSRTKLFPSHSLFSSPIPCIFLPSLVDRCHFLSYISQSWRRRRSLAKLWGRSFWSLPIGICNPSFNHLAPFLDSHTSGFRPTAGLKLYNGLSKDCNSFSLRQDRPSRPCQGSC